MTQTLIIIGDSGDNDTIIIWLCLLFIVCSCVTSTCYRTMSAGTQRGLFCLQRQIREWSRGWCWLSASLSPTQQGHSGALCGQGQSTEEDKGGRREKWGRWNEELKRQEVEWRKDRDQQLPLYPIASQDIYSLMCCVHMDVEKSWRAPTFTAAATPSSIRKVGQNPHNAERCCDSTSHRIRPACRAGTRYYHVCQQCFWFHSDFPFYKRQKYV